MMSALHPEFWRREMVVLLGVKHDVSFIPLGHSEQRDKKDNHV